MGPRFSAPVQTGPGAHPASCKMGTGSFPEVKGGRGVTLTSHPFQCRGQERVEVYLYSPYGPYGLYRTSVPVQGCTLPLPLPFILALRAIACFFRNILDIYVSCPSIHTNYSVTDCSYSHFGGLRCSLPAATYQTCARNITVNNGPIIYLNINSLSNG